jgi:hypothetical protein
MSNQFSPLSTMDDDSILDQIELLDENDYEALDTLIDVTHMELVDGFKLLHRFD